MIKRSAVRLRGFIIFAVLVWCGLHPGLPAAAESQSSCNELEVVIIVDQSGSMPGSPDHPKANDPHGLRFFAPLRVVRWMGQDFVGASGLRVPSRPVITYHLALVEFGDQAQVRLPWTTVAPASEQEWQRQAEKLAESLAPQKGDLGNTNFLAAFEAARDLFAQRSGQRGGCPRRAILLLSDGMPYVAPPEGGHFSVVAHTNAVKSLVQEDLAKAGAEVWVTAINDSDDNYWPRMEPIWKGMLPPDEADKQPHAWLVNTEDEIGERFMRLMVELTGRRVEPVMIGPRCVPPYLQEIVLTFYKRDPAEHLDVQDPSGPLVPARNDVEVEIIGYDEPIESLRVRRPLPGKWQVSTTAPRADVIIDEVTLPAVGRLIQPVDQPGVQYIQDRVVFQITDSQGNPLPAYADPLFAMSIVGEIKASNQSFPVSFTPDAQQAYSALFIPIQSGLHQLVISAASRQPQERVPPGTSDCQWKPFDVLKDETIGQFDVTAIRMLLLGLPQTESATGADCPLQVGDRAIVRYQTQAADNQRPVVLSLPVEWEATLESSVGSSAVSLEGPDRRTGVYTATLAFNQAGGHVLKAIASVRQPDGSLQRLLVDKQSFDVRPVHELQAIVRLADTTSKPWWWGILDRLGLTPQDPGMQIARDPFWQWLPTDVEVLVSLDGQNPADPATVLKSDASAGGLPVRLIVAEAGGVNPQTVQLEYTNVPGRYRGTLPNLRLGHHELRVEGAKGFFANCGYSLPTPALMSLERVENPWIYLELLLAALLLIIVLLLLRRWRCQRVNPCKGYISVLGQDNRPVGGWYIDLKGRNTWRLRGNLAPPDITGIQEMLVRSARGRCGRDPYENDRLWVQITLLSLTETPEAPQERVLSPGEQWRPEQLPGCAVKYVLEQKQLYQS